MTRSVQRAQIANSVKFLYKVVCERRGSWLYVRELENLLRTDFRNTADFHAKCQSFLSTGAVEGAGDQLKKVRESIGWGQIQLAKELKCSQQLVSFMEKGQRKLTRRAAEFIKSTKIGGDPCSTLPGNDFSSKNPLEKSA